MVLYASTILVKDLVCPITRQWKLGNLENDLPSDFVLDLRNKLGLFFGGKDRAVWKFSKSGKFSVSSAYSNPKGSEWSLTPPLFDRSKLWKLQHPYRILMFIWKLCRSGVPVRAKLHQRIQNMVSICSYVLLIFVNLYHLCLIIYFSFFFFDIRLD